MLSRHRGEMLNPAVLFSLQRSSYLTRSIVFTLSLVMSAATNSLSAWTFISSPDWFNRDIADLSGSTPGVPPADGWVSHTGLNGVSPEMQAVYDSVVAEMAAYGPEAFVVTGDLINGRWFNDETLAMFDPVDRNRQKAIDKAADIYYSWYRELFNSHGIDPVLGAVGDHEIGDDDWLPGSEKSLHVQNMKRAFGRNMVDTLSTGLLPGINGADARPYGLPYEYGSYAYQHRNLLFVTVDLFRQDDPNTQLHLMHGSVSPDINGAHLTWLSSLLNAAKQDASIDHVIVQGHTPVLRPVRMQITSGMMLVDREDSAFWQLLRQHDHRHGGKVRIFFGGEVHAVTVSKDPDSDLIQLVHGNPPIFDGLGNYVVFQVEADRIEAELRRFPLSIDGTSWYWQPSNPNSPGVSSVGASFSAGTLVIDASGSETRYTTSGDMALVDQRGLTMHFDFDQKAASGNFSNRGSIGNDFYEGIANGGAVAVPGVLGSALQLNGATAFVESGRGNITEGESRSVSAWVKSSYAGVQGLFSYGRDKWNSSLNGRFVFQLSDGRPQLAISPNISCLPNAVARVTDGKWHHVAIVLTDKHRNSCADIRFYVDGTVFAASSANAGAPLDTVPWSNIRIGAGVGGSLGTQPDDFFNGAIDDAAMWGSPLTDSKVRAIATAGSDTRLRYDASAMEQLFDLFDAQQGSVSIAQRKWIYTKGLQGSGGDVLNHGGGIAIQLDQLGNGVVEEVNAAFMPILYLYLRSK